MTIFRRNSFALFAALLIVAGCSHTAHLDSEARPAGARLITAEAIRIAEQAAEHDGRHLSDYKSPEAHYEYTQKNKSWWVFFDGKVPMPGNHFSVTIDDQTGKTQLMPGD